MELKQKTATNRGFLSERRPRPAAAWLQVTQIGDYDSSLPFSQLVVRSRLL